MIKQKFFKNSNSFRENGGDFHAVFGVKDGSCGELGTNLPSTSYRECTFPVNKGSRADNRQNRDRHRTKRRSIVCTLELLSGDAFYK